MNDQNLSDMHKKMLFPLALVLTMALTPALIACSDDDDELIDSVTTETTTEAVDDTSTGDTPMDSDSCCE